MARGREAFLSQHIGNLNSPAACAALDEAAEHLQTILSVRPAAVAHDAHPDYYSTRAALEMAARLGVPAVAVQHHHAHIAAVCAEHSLDGPVLGFAADGVGLGTDGMPWGGELLQVDGAEFQRLGHLAPLPLPGGDRAAREPWRMACAAWVSAPMRTMMMAGTPSSSCSRSKADPSMVRWAASTMSGRWRSRCSRASVMDSTTSTLQPDQGSASAPATACAWG